ncbi:hypothetical protein Phi18:2_gp45 [Cellulophaga phage phi18:2]|uniref:Uncharacterized protein n=5 Tax=Helsingorvirus TaxID=1918017 RepID=R9ZY00_9CAUD|nr:hypothetical protein Phi18:1_gp47 [Cellulophaga phage phi18:1]YP_008241024.1 hypothetical protein Phi12:1_gp45 [Cellulophaga phage phi12:1]YP_008241363.1 hypothetical protein Phi17:1_gp47 [Cellulophaga phage phi17:1]AGO48176.1 hypothetical protein Phi12:3_gp45 [Cellulophaga phage phi12:3]AGO49208.1 hypothetical protein Phi18:2_gp45 [Cellulophaga phage phi18:2]AGO48011.1 hypothetical protein Phi12:1_gp45 [Cellulophaga phage phi12:1]AGO48323.1 hypothetical protein Phi17:1_gp47 [Cellulophaga 
MTESEVINQIISQPKYYIGIMPQSTASLFVKRWREGKAKRKTIEAFCLKFGYKCETNIKYYKL